METLDATVLATSLPDISESLKIDPISLKLALTSYMLSLAVFIPISGWAADKYGARRVFIAAILMFTASSALCGMASSLPEFVAFRFLQGIGGAMMVPVGRLVILRAVPKPEIISALAWLTIPALFGPVVGPIFGGFITTYLHWRWIFYINIPVGVIGLILSYRFIPNVFEVEMRKLDKTGFALSSLGLSLFVFGLAVIGEQANRPLPGIILTVAGLLVWMAYTRHARRTPHPVINLSLLKITTFRTAVIGGSMFRMGVGALPFLLPLMLQLGFGLSAFQSGLLTFASAAGALVMKTAAAPILRRFGFRRVMIVTALLSAIFLCWNGLFTPSTSHAIIILVLLLGGFFRSLSFTAINALGYADIAPADMSSATSFSSVAQQISFSMGVAIGALVLQGAQAYRGAEQLLLSDFSLAFFLIGGLSAFALISFVSLPESAGQSLSSGEEEPAPEALEKSEVPGSA